MRVSARPAPRAVRQRKTSGHAGVPVPALHPLATLQRAADAFVQRQAFGAAPVQRADDMDDEPMQMVADEEEPMQMMADEEEPLQGKDIGAAMPAPGGAESSTALPPDLRAGIESLSGYSMDGVTVHRNSAKPATVQAHAYAQGTDIHVAPGQEKHLPHEAWHVVQQAQGRVAPTMQMADVAINDSPALESEADRMGAQAKSLGSAAMQRKSLDDS